MKAVFSTNHQDDNVIVTFQGLRRPLSYFLDELLRYRTMLSHQDAYKIREQNTDLISEIQWLKEQNATQQHLIYELVKNGGKICKGYETINIVLPQLDEIRTTNVQTVQASD